MADNSKNEGTTAEEVVGIAGGLVAQCSPIVCFITGSMLAADLFLFGGIGTLLLAASIKGKRESNER
jgi:hypothetical protein